MVLWESDWELYIYFVLQGFFMLNKNRVAS